MIILLLILLLVIFTILEFAIVGILSNIVEYILIGIVGSIVAMILYCCFWSLVSKNFRKEMVSSFKELNEIISNHISKQKQLMIGLALVVCASAAMIYIAYTNLSLKGQAIKYYEEETNNYSDRDYEPLYEGDDFIILQAEELIDIPGIDGAKNIVVYSKEERTPFKFILHDGDKDCEYIKQKAIETSMQKYDEERLRSDLIKIRYR